MDATGVARAEVQPAPGETTIVRAIARFTAAHKLFFVSAVLQELRQAPLVNPATLEHFEREHARLSRELGIGASA